MTKSKQELRKTSSFNILEGPEVGTLADYLVKGLGVLYTSSP
jgi:hypothetical protein